MEEWYYQFPSLTKRIKVVGDYQRSLAYTGEVRKMLYQLKNNMQFQQLGQLRMVRYFIDGTVIIAKSVFGLDSVEIMVSGGRDLLPGMGLCSITLINVPEVVQPMRYPGEIKEGEVEGVDYIKTYYTVDLSQCAGCILQWNMINNAMQESDAGRIYKLFNPFIFHDLSVVEWIEAYRWYYGYGPNETHPYVDASLIRPDDHCARGNCAGEIIEFGSDDGGSWIKWKAYTEYSYSYPGITEFTRTGFGTMELNGFVGTRDINPLWTPATAYVGMEALVVNETCSGKGRILVDCCRKAPEDRSVGIHWEKCVISAWCPAPDVTAMSNLAYFQVWSWVSMGLKAAGDGCVPYEWSVKGMGEIIGDGDKKLVSYKVPMETLYGRGCHEDLTISVIDRCGTSDSILFKSCCGSSPAPVLIGYTSLLMSCSGSQTLSARGGCAPYSWAITGGGGTLVASVDTASATYTAPSGNQGCSSNPTITLTDCCGKTASIKIAVSCGVAGTALCQCTVSCSSTGCFWWDPHWNCNASLVWTQKTWDCDGNLISETSDSTMNSWYDNCWDACTRCDHISSCSTTGVQAYAALKGWSENGFGCGSAEPYCDGSLKDVRTATMKTNGCCPINPLTGLPYD